MQKLQEYIFKIFSLFVPPDRDLQHQILLKFLPSPQPTQVKFYDFIAEMELAHSHMQIYGYLIISRDTLIAMSPWNSNLSVIACHLVEFVKLDKGIMKKPNWDIT